MARRQGVPAAEIPTKLKKSTKEETNEYRAKLIKLWCNVSPAPPVLLAVAKTTVGWEDWEGQEAEMWEAAENSEEEEGAEEGGEEAGRGGG